MAALVLMDQLMAHISQCEMFPLNLDLQEPVSAGSSVSELAPNLS
jgi:chorismate synthase